MQEENTTQYINQAYKIWKKHCPLLYNFLQVYQLPSCSQTLDWFHQSYIQSDRSISSLLIGSNSLTKNYLSVININIPTDSTLIDNTLYQEKPPNNSVYTMGQQNLNVRISLPQNSQIMKARINKVQQNWIACKTGGNEHEVSLYNLNYDTDSIEDNKISLEGHECEGFGLSWHKKKTNLIASGSYDKKVLVWDINWEGSKGFYPIFQAAHLDGVQDVKWTDNQSVLGTVGQDRMINIWDIREDPKKPSVSKLGHSGEIYSLQFSPFSEYLMATGGQDTDVMIWDTRNMSKKIQCLVGHNDSVNVVSWSKTNPFELVSGGSDRRVVVWSLKGSEDASNNIQFIHGGHRSKITDLSWKQNSNCLASSQMQNILHVWHMNQKIYTN